MFALLICACATGAESLAKKPKKPSRKKISVNEEITDEGILVTFINNNSMKVHLKATFTYKDANGAALGTPEDIENRAFAKGAKMVYFFKGPRNDVNQFIAYSSHSLAFSVTRTTYKNFTSDIEITTHIEPLVCKCSDCGAFTFDTTSSNAWSATA